MRKDDGAFARRGCDSEIAADHLQSLSHAEQSQSFALLGMHYAFRPKAFAVVGYGHPNGVVQFLELHVRLAGLRMARDIGERFLGDALEHGSFVTVQLLNGRKSRQTEPNTRLGLEMFHKRVEGGNQPQVIQYRRTQFPGELMHDIH